MMIRRRELSFLAAAFAVGSLANLLFGPSPDAIAQLPPDKNEWAVPGADLPDLAALDAGWEARAPWGARPRAPEAAPVPPPPPPAPVGIARGRKGQQEVIFLVADQGAVRVAPGESLPDGGRLLRVSGMRVTWIDGEGQEQQREMFLDPPRALPVSMGASTGMGSAVPMPLSAGTAQQGRSPPSFAGLLRGGTGGATGQGVTRSPRGNASASSRPASSGPAATPAATPGQQQAAPAAGAGNVTTVSAQSLRKSPAGQSGASASSQSRANNPPPAGLFMPPGRNTQPPATSQKDEKPGP